MQVTKHGSKSECRRYDISALSEQRSKEIVTRAGARPVGETASRTNCVHHDEVIE